MAMKLQYLLALVVAAGVSISSGGRGVEAQSSCRMDFQDLVSHCTRFVQRNGPMVPGSAECCRVIKPFDMSCACSVITKDIEDIISMEKAVFVVRSCGIKVPAGLKCGSYTVPPPRT